MPDYFVLVTKPDGEGALETKLCGHLWSTHHVKAQLEAIEYQKQLNGGWPLEVLRGQYHTVTASPTSTTRGLRGFSRFKTRRVTDKKKWNTAKK